jgi:hypothetical protein
LVKKTKKISCGKRQENQGCSRITLLGLFNIIIQIILG